MDALSIVIVVLAFGYIGYVALETILNKKYRKSFKYIIHVNGIRGKSTTTRLIDAGFRGCGYRVFSKTTGTVPTMINTSNAEVVIKRLGLANIREQLSIIRKACKEKAEVLVIECMAVNPDLQKICEEKILKADVTVITNVRPDHIMDMGENTDDIALAFCGTIPENGQLVINPGDYVEVFKEHAKNKNTLVHIAKEYAGSDDLNTFSENISISLEVARALSLNENDFFEGMKKYHQDFGAFEKIRLNNTLFLNGLSINDPVSIKVMYEKILKSYDASQITILLNNRNDRPTRVLQHIEMMKDIDCKKLLIIGSNPSYVKKKVNILNPTLNVEIVKKIEDLINEEIIFAIGNIGEKGMKILNYFRKNGERQ